MTEEQHWRRVRAAIRQSPGTISELATRLSMPVDKVKDAIDALQSAGQIVSTDNRWRWAT